MEVVLPLLHGQRLTKKRSHSRAENEQVHLPAEQKSTEKKLPSGNHDLHLRENPIEDAKYARKKSTSMSGIGVLLRLASDL
jgi:hypothetical protein